MRIARAQSNEDEPTNRLRIVRNMTYSLKYRNAREALRSHNEALEKTTRALSMNPGSLDLQNKLSLIHVSIGAAYEALGNRERRLESYLTALKIRKSLVEANPDNAEWKRLLSWAYFWVGGHYKGYRRDDGVTGLPIAYQDGHQVVIAINPGVMAWR